MHEPVNCILCRHKSTRDAGRARAAIGLQHITIEVDGSLAQFSQIEHGTHRAANEALNFLRSATLFAAGGFAIATRVRCAGQHAIFGCDPAFAAALFVSWYFFFHRGGTQNTGIAKLNEHRAFCVHGVAACDPNYTQLILLSCMCACDGCGSVGHGEAMFKFEIMGLIGPIGPIDLRGHEAQWPSPQQISSASLPYPRKNQCQFTV